MECGIRGIYMESGMRGIYMATGIRGILPAGRLWALKVSRDRESWDRERDVCPPPPPIGSMHAGGTGVDARFECIVS